VVSYHDTIVRLGPLGIADVLVSIPALLALHLHVWDKRLVSASFWRPYAFVLPVWDAVFSFLLAPMVTGKRGQPIELLGFCLLLPLYVAVFR
jgi:hypothetical protein